jgi:hypothetical protein
MRRTERIIILTAVLFIGLGLMQILTRGVGAEPVLPDLLIWAMALLLMLIAGMGALWVRSAVAPAGAAASQGAVVHSEPRVVESYLPLVGPLALPLRIVTPVMMAAAFMIFTQMFESGPVQALVLVVAGLSFSALYWAQVHSTSINDRYFWFAQTLLNIIAHLTAFLLFSVIYGLKVRSLISGSAVAVATGLLIYEMLSRDAEWHRAMNLPVRGRTGTLALLSMGAGVVAGELTWALNYWAALPALVGGAFLLVVFYVLFGVASHYIDGTLTRRVLAEFGLVGAISVGVILTTAFFG